MIKRIGLVTSALLLLAVTAVSAQQVVSGTVVRIDQPASVVVLDNGLMYRATPQTVFLVNNQPTTFATIQPGTPIVVQYGQPVMVRDGRYVVVTQPAPASPVVVAPQPAVTVLPSGLYETSGVVRWVGASEPGRASITLDDGRHIWIDENTQVLANGAPVMVSTLRPGTFVVVRSSKPLAFRSAPSYATAPAPVVVTQPTATVVSGTVVRIDQPNTIVLSDGRVVPATAQTVVMVDNRAVPFTTLQPGTPVVIYPGGTSVITSDPNAFPRGTIYPEIGVREKAAERNSP
jgi:hypothetical protein